MKILTVIGARPQFIKAATVSRALAGHSRLQEVIVHTGQHYDANMSDVFFDELAIPRPLHNLGVGGSTHGAMTGRMLEKLESVMMDERPDKVLVYGDTNSTLAGALAAVKLHIPVLHVEAGLRSFNRAMPEEINRIVTDHVSDVLFAPTETARRNLVAEGVGDAKIRLTGDVMYDAALFYGASARRPGWFDGLGIAEHGFVLATIHRAENTDDAARLRQILAGLEKGGRPVVLPLHPRTKAKIAEFGITMPQNACVVPPVGYLEMVWLEQNCLLVATDSGGVQKEAFFHAKHCITLRTETEWVELVDCGWNVIVDDDSGKIAAEIRRPRDQTVRPALYGDGDAAAKIAGALA